jgi:predicted nucleotidyltransferase
MNDKDALDLYRVISSYAEAGNFDRLFDEEIQFLEQADHDPSLTAVFAFALWLMFFR